MSDFFLQISMLSWVISGISTGMFLAVIARVLMYSYQQHGYLYQNLSAISGEAGLSRWSQQLLDTWVSSLVPLVRRLTLTRYRLRLTKLLSQSGSRRDWTPDHFVAFQAVLAGVVGLVSFTFLYLILGVNLFWVLTLILLSLLIPYLRLADTALVRMNASHRELPFFVDYLALAMSSGADFNRAVKVAVQHVPQSPLKDEFALMLQNMRFGMSRQMALEELQRRLDTPPIRLFCKTVAQSLTLGSHLGSSLSRMSGALQQKRFQLAEEQAGQISVKIMIPTMIFIMPAVLVVLLGPMVLAYFTNA